MPWVSRDDLAWLRHRAKLADERHDALVEARRREGLRREQVRHLRRTIHRLRSDIGAAVNVAVREAHTPVQEAEPGESVP